MSYIEHREDLFLWQDNWSDMQQQQGKGFYKDSKYTLKQGQAIESHLNSVRVIWERKKQRNEAIFDRSRNFF